MKLHAISDLHVGYRENLESLSEFPDSNDDWLILCGDIADTPEQLESALEILTRKFAKLIWVPGNHELWSLPRKTALRGVARYEQLVALCRTFDVLTPEDPFPVWDGEGGRHLLAPLFLLYDYTFRPDHVPVDEAVAWARETGVRCTDEVVLHPDPYPSRGDWCRARCRESEQRLDAAIAEHDLPVVLIAHFPLREEHAILPRIPRFKVWCGTRETEDWHRRFNASVVISGHLHIPSTRYVDGVRFEEVSLGYPDQWRMREEYFGWKLADHLRQILPTPEVDAGDPIAEYERLIREQTRNSGRPLRRRRGPARTPGKKDASMNLDRLHEDTISEDEIDDLGHMNVRYYGERALEATGTLIARHGLAPEVCARIGASVEVRDIFTRHYREQLVGASLAVMGGVLEVRENGFRLYHELVNTDTGELAATFVHDAQLQHAVSHTPLALPDDARKSLGESIVGWPEHGRSRSIELDRTPPRLTLSEARERGLALRKERRVLDAECDASGFVPPARRQELVWVGEPIPPHAGGPPMFDLEDGSRMSMAALETRSQLFESARVGTRIQSFAAIVDIGRKTTIRRTWVFDLDRERLLHSNTLVDIALHLGKRRSLEIPPAVRAQFESVAQLDLR